jgi:hypothetical protein
MSAKEPMEGLELKRAQDSLIFALKQYTKQYQNHKELLDGMRRNLALLSHLTADDLQEMADKFEKKTHEGSILDHFGKNQASNSILAKFRTLIHVVKSHEQQLDPTDRLVQKIRKIDDLVDEKQYALIADYPNYEKLPEYQALKALKAELHQEFKKTWNPGPRSENIGHEISGDCTRCV